MDWVEFPERGTLIAFTCISVGPPFMVAEGFDRKHPYCSGVVELEGGVRTAARIEGVEAAKPDTIKVGSSVSALYLHRGDKDDKRTYLAFKPA